MKQDQSIRLSGLLLTSVGCHKALCLLLLGLFWCYSAPSVHAQPQPDSQSMTSHLVEEAFYYNPETCFINYLGQEQCGYYIRYELEWSKDAQYPAEPPCPNGCWSSNVWMTSDEGSYIFAGTRYDYSGRRHVITREGSLTHEEARQFREETFSKHWRVFSYFTTAEGEEIALESNPGAGFLNMDEDPEDKDLALGPYSNASCKGDPVYLHSGKFYYACEDLQTPGRKMDVQLGHTYYSGMSFNGPFGYGWFFNYYLRLHQLSNGNIVITSGDGRKTEYTPVSDTVYHPPAGRFEILKKNPDNSWTLTQAHGEQWQIDADGKLTTIEDRNGNTISFVYDPEQQPYYGPHPYSQDPSSRILLGMDYRLTEIHADNGRIINLTYNVDGLLEKIIDNGREVVFAYDPATNDLVSITKPVTDQYPSGVTKSFEYEDHQVKRIKDAKQQYFVENHYDAEGRVYQQDLGEGSFLFDYSVEKQTTVTDRKGHVTIYKFNDNGNPESEEILTPTGSYITTSTYNADMLKTSETLPEGNGIEYAYDENNPDPRSQGNLLQIRRKADMNQPDDDAMDLVTRISYTSNVPPPVEFNLPQTVTDPEGNVTEYKYDYEMPSEDPRYGTNGNLVTITYPQVEAGIPQVDLTYNQYGQVTQREDPNGNLNEYEYYSDTGYLQKVIQDRAGINAVTEFAYDVYGNLDWIKDANGHTTDFQFDALNWLNHITNPLGYVTKYSQDANGNITKVERQKDTEVAQWQVTNLDYDILNHLKIITDPLSRPTVYEYDANENLESILDAEGNLTEYAYDERDLLSTITDANGPQGITQYSYDPNGNLQQILDANNNPTTYAYDKFDRLFTTTYADGSVEELGYDKNSNVNQRKTPSTYPDVAFSYEYDALNRLEAVRNLGNPTLDKTFVYDLSSRLTDANTTAALNHFTYDNLNRVATNIQTLSPTPYTLTYQYDKVDNRTKVIYPSGKTVDYVYDDNNRMTDVKVNGTRMTSFKYDPLDRRVERDYLIPQEFLLAQQQAGSANIAQIQGGPGQNAAGIQPRAIEKYHGVIQRSSYQWDDANQLKDLTNLVVDGPNISRYQYSLYDNVGNRKQMIASDGTHDYGYNSLYEITEEKINNIVEHSYDYDRVANRKVADGTIYIPNNLNQYDSVGGVTYTYDANGNLTNDGINTYTYDEENRLSSIFPGPPETIARAGNPQFSATYAYDAFNRRISKTVNGDTIYFIYDGNRIIEDRDVAGGLIADYIYGVGIDEILSMERQGQRYYYQYDGLGSVREITDSKESVVESYEYDPYGTPSAINSSIGNRYRFTGREFDEESGIYYFRARMYDPKIGRFQQRDPIGYFDSMNLFQYTFNSPSNWIDPFGLDVVVLNDPSGAFGFGHQAMAIGDDEKGWVYFSQDGPNAGGGHSKKYSTLKELLQEQSLRYNRSYRIETSPEQDKGMADYAKEKLDNPYSANPFSSKRYHCGDLVSGALESGGVKIGKKPFGNIPNDAYNEIKKANPKPPQ